MQSEPNTVEPLPHAVVEALPQIGGAIRTARIRRRRTSADFASRLGVSAPTLRKLERGDPGVSLGTFLTALWLLDLLKDLRTTLDPTNDRVGVTLELSRLPKRVRRIKEPDLDQL